MSRASAWGLDTGTPDLDWRVRGACNHADLDLFTSPSPDHLGQARWVCLNACAVIRQCLTWAGQHPGLVDRAVYGGLHWTRRSGPTGNPVGVARPSDVQPVPRRPDGQPRQPQRARARQGAHIPLKRHLDEIRALYAADVPTVDIAARYGCSPQAIRCFAARNGIRRSERAA